MNKKYEKIMSYFLVFIMIFSYISPIYGMFDVYAEGEEIPGNEFVDPVYPEVSSDKYTLKGLDLENNTLKVNVNEEKVITLETEEDYFISSCYFTGNYYSGTEFVEVNHDMNSCTISPYNYGKGYITIQVSNMNYSSYEYVKFYIDAEIDNYLDMVVNKIPENVGTDLWQYLEDGISMNDYSNTCQDNDDNNTRTCNVEFKYCYRNIESDEEECVSKSRNVEFDMYSYDKGMVSSKWLRIELGKSEQLTVNNYEGDYVDLIWVSENNDIASVDQNGKVIANGVGKTLVKLYNKKTFEYETVEVVVYNDEDKMTIDEFVNLFDSKKLTIDINHENNVFSFNRSWDEVNGETIVPNYLEIINRYLINSLNDYDLTQYSFKNVTCNENICSFEIYKWNNGIQETVTTVSDLEIDLIGLRITNPAQNMPINTRFLFDYIKYLNTNSDVSINYDENYIQLTAEGDYRAIKAGITEVQIITDGYIDTMKVSITYSDDYINQLSSYMNSIKSIVLPYNSLELSSKTDLKYLENILKNKIIDDYPSEQIKSMLQSEVHCLSSNICSFKLFVSEDYVDLLGDSSVDRIIKVSYDNSDNDTIQEIKRLNDVIKDTSFVGLDTVIGLENNCNNDDCFYDSLITNSDLNNIANNSTLDVDFELIETFEFKKFVKGGAKYLVKISKDNKVLFTKEIVINSDHIVNMDASLDKEGRSERLKFYVDDVLRLLNVDCSVSLIYDNVYEVTVGEKSFNLILDQKDAVEIYQVDVTDRLFEIKTGESKKIRYKYYPYNGTIGSPTFEVDNSDIATVDSLGNVTGISKGYTFVSVKLGSSISRVLIAVDMTVKEVLNSYLHFIDDNITVDYSSLRGDYDTLENAISNKISNKFYEGEFWLPLVAIVNKENDKYYAAIGYNTTNIYGGNVVTSDFKEITFDYEGIKLDKYHYDLSVGDEVDTKLFFSEGDNNNLYFSYEREGVVELTKDGKLRALKPGVTSVYINDKYNKYWNHITVTVSFDEFFASVGESLKTDKIIVNAIDYGRYNRFNDIVNNKLNQRLPMYSLNKPTRLDCDEETLTCSFQILKDYTWNSEVVKEMTFPVEKEGIFVDEYELELAINGEKEIKFDVLNDIKDEVRVSSLNEDICKIEDNKIIGVGPGLCNIKYQSKKNLAYQHIIVGRNEIITAYETALSTINDGLEVPLLGFDYNNHNFEDTNMLEYNINILPINNKIKQLISLDTDYYVWAGRTESDDENRYENMEITVSPNFSFQDSKNMYYYNYQDNTGIFDVKKTVDITPVEINKDDLKIGAKIKEQVKDKYTLSMLQYLRLRLSGKTSGLLEYSDFYELVKRECPTCTIEFGEGGFGGSDDMSFVQEGGTYVIFKDYNPIATFELNFEASIDVLQSGEIFSELDFINLIKETVRDAYLKAIKELTGVSRMSTRNVKSYRLTDEVEVDVKKEFDPSIGQAAYVITVDDITFKTTAKTEVKGEVNYTYSVTNLELSESNLTLNKGQSKVIGYRVTPDNATNKEVKFESSNNNVVTVDQNGTIIATGAGTATITVTAKDGSNISKQVTVTVIDNNPSTGGSGEAPSEQQPEIKVLLGDVNVDGKINMNDLITLRKYFAGNVTLSSQGLKNVDITKEGKKNMNDLIGLRKFLAN